MASEFSRVSLIEALLKRASDHVLVGIGDDAAVVAEGPGASILTVDSAVEDVHFSRASMPLSSIGYRAFMAAASDIAAMGGRATCALSALILPADLDDAQLTELVSGIARAADACACPVVGGNLARGRELSLTTTVVGTALGQVVTRGRARPGDGLYVTGTLGGAALGLRALQAGFDSVALERFLSPRARLDLSGALSAVASAAIDVSDGALQDLGHLCAASRVGARVELEALPLLPGMAEEARAHGLDPHALALEGGDDYELLFTSAQPVDFATRIGTIVPASEGVRALGADGAVFQPSRGFDHFADS